MNFWIQILIPMAFLISSFWADNILELEHEILKNILNDTAYDKTVRPFGRNKTGAVVVEVNMFLRSLGDFDDAKMTYSTQLVMRQIWQDDRLKYNSKRVEYVMLAGADKIWVPDLFFSNERTGYLHNILTPNTLVRIYPDGRVLYSTRVSLELNCPMNLKNYPMDTQVCNIVAASYRYTTKDVTIVWKPFEPVQVSRTLFSPKFSLTRFKPDICTGKTNTGEYGCVTLKLHFSRHFTYYIVQDFILTFCLVTMSWIAFWVHPRSIRMRTGIWIASFFFMVIMAVSAAKTAPQTSYVKALDVWMIACVVFIFCVIIEIGLANSAVRKEDRSSGVKSMEAADKEMDLDDGVKNDTNKLSNYSTMLRKKFSTTSGRIDVVSRFLFPTAFVAFNFFFWLTYAP